MERLMPSRVRQGAVLSGRAPKRARDKHRNAASVALVIAAVLPKEIPLLELDCEHDVRGRGHGEEEMGESHVRRRPEGDQKSQIERMSYNAVRKRRAKCYRRIRPADQRKPGLAQPEEIEMVDVESHRQHGGPPRRTQRPDSEPSMRAVDTPDNDAYGAPLPEQQQQRETRT